jgi:hypothetical protein
MILTSQQKGDAGLRAGGDADNRESHMFLAKKQ